MTGFKPIAYVLTGLWAVALLLAAAGCTSEVPSSVGTPLVGGEIDVVLEPLEMSTVEAYNGLAITDADVPLGRQEVLYMGSEGGTSSSILMNFDFSNIFTDSLPEEAFTADNIISVDLRLLMLEYYGLLYQADDVKALETVYELFMLDAPFDSTAYPAGEPPHSPVDISNNSVPDISSEPLIGMEPVFFLNWVANAGQQGLMVRRGESSQDGLLGYSARDMLHGGSTLNPVEETTLVGPVLIVKFIEPDTTVSFSTYADISTFHEIDPTPADIADGFMMRTCLRSYPALRFDFSAMPANIFINRAVLAVRCDTATSFGNLASIVVSEFPTDVFGGPGDSMPLTDLDDWTYQISGMSSLDPNLHDNMQFNVTAAVQRIVNSVYEGDKGFILAGGEDFFPIEYRLFSVDPGFFFTQFNFFGTSAADSLRPRLLISYSSLDELTGGGE